MKMGKVLSLGVAGLLVAMSLAMESCTNLLCLVDPSFYCPDPPTVDCWNQPAGTVAVNFTIDATTRPGIYHDKDLEWKGDFTYDGGTNILTPNTGWAGPYVPLWDDGQWVDCGHEPLGAVAGDNKFGIAAWMTIPTS